MSTIFFSKQIIQTSLECKKILTEFELLLTKYEGHKIEGMIGSWLSTINLNLGLIELEALCELSNKPKKYSCWDLCIKEGRENIFALKQIKFMLAMGHRIPMPKENPNDVIKEHLAN